MVKLKLARVDSFVNDHGAFGLDTDYTDADSGEFMGWSFIERSVNGEINVVFGITYDFNESKTLPIPDGASVLYAARVTRSAIRSAHA